MPEQSPAPVRPVSTAKLLQFVLRVDLRKLPRHGDAVERELERRKYERRAA